MLYAKLGLSTYLFMPLLIYLIFPVAYLILISEGYFNSVNVWCECVNALRVFQSVSTIHLILKCLRPP